MERVFFNAILTLDVAHEIIPKKQHSFLPGRSILTNLLPFIDNWIKTWDLGVPVVEK